MTKTPSEVAALARRAEEQAKLDLAHADREDASGNRANAEANRWRGIYLHRLAKDLREEKNARRETVELVNHQTYFSDDNWETVWKISDSERGGVSPVTDKVEADRIRYIAVIKYGGGRNDYEGC